MFCELMTNSFTSEQSNFVYISSFAASSSSSSLGPGRINKSIISENMDTVHFFLSVSSIINHVARFFLHHANFCFNPHLEHIPITSFTLSTFAAQTVQPANSVNETIPTTSPTNFNFP